MVLGSLAQPSRFSPPMIIYYLAVLSSGLGSFEFPYINTLHHVVTCNCFAEPLFAIFPARNGDLTA
jgi:hypothetical protein